VYASRLAARVGRLHLEPPAGVYPYVSVKTSDTVLRLHVGEAYCFTDDEARLIGLGGTRSSWTRVGSAELMGKLLVLYVLAASTLRAPRGEAATMCVSKGLPKSTIVHLSAVVGGQAEAVQGRLSGSESQWCRHPEMKPSVDGHDPYPVVRVVGATPRQPATGSDVMSVERLCNHT
jgi:hypothetical protein